MIKNYYSMAMVISAIFAGSGALASEVYITQAGDGTLVNITQTGVDNQVGDVNTRSILDGNYITVDITQTGNNNRADLLIDNNANSTNIDYIANGSDNTLKVSIDGGNSNSLTANVDGSDNSITMCDTNSTGVVSVSCSSGSQASTVVTQIDITGGNNAVNIEARSSFSTNTIAIGSGALSVSNDNTVNIEQGTGGPHHVNIAIDGSTNTINIIQN
jgi:hypothetical protein